MKLGRHDRRANRPRLGGEFSTEVKQRVPDKVEKRTLREEELGGLLLRRPSVNLDTVEEYLTKIRETLPPPIHVLVTSIEGEQVGVVLDGPHRAVAAYLNGMSIPAVLLYKEHPQLEYRLRQMQLTPLAEVSLENFPRRKRK